MPGPNEGGDEVDPNAEDNPYESEEDILNYLYGKKYEGEYDDLPEDVKKAIEEFNLRNAVLQGIDAGVFTGGIPGGDGPDPFLMGPFQEVPDTGSTGTFTYDDPSVDLPVTSGLPDTGIDPNVPYGLPDDTGNPFDQDVPISAIEQAGGSIYYGGGAPIFIPSSEFLPSDLADEFDKAVEEILSGISGVQGSIDIANEDQIAAIEALQEQSDEAGQQEIITIDPVTQTPEYIKDLLTEINDLNLEVSDLEIPEFDPTVILQQLEDTEAASTQAAADAGEATQDVVEQTGAETQDIVTATGQETQQTVAESAAQTQEDIEQLNEALQELIQSGNTDLQTLVEAGILDVTQAVEGDLETLNESIASGQTTLNEAIDSGVAGISGDLEGIAETLVEQGGDLADLGDALATQGSETQELIEGSSEATQELIEGTSEETQQLIEGTSEETQEQITQSQEEIQQAIADGSISVQEAIDAGLLELSEGVTADIDALTSEIQSGQTTLEDLANEGIVEVQTTAAETQDVVEQTGIEVIDAIDATQESIDAAIAQLAEQAGTDAETIKEQIKSGEESTKEGLTAIGEAMEQLPEVFQEALRPYLEGIDQGIASLTSDQEKNLTDILEAIGGLNVPVISAIADSTADTINAITGVTDWLQNAAEAVVTKLREEPAEGPGASVEDFAEGYAEGPGIDRTGTGDVIGLESLIPGVDFGTGFVGGVTGSTGETYYPADGANVVIDEPPGRRLTLGDVIDPGVDRGVDTSGMQLFPGYTGQAQRLSGTLDTYPELQRQASVEYGVNMAAQFPDLNPQQQGFFANYVTQKIQAKEGLAEDPGFLPFDIYNIVAPMLNDVLSNYGMHDYQTGRRIPGFMQYMPQASYNLIGSNAIYGSSPSQTGGTSAATGTTYSTYNPGAMPGGSI